MNGTPTHVQRCLCGGYPMRAEEGKALGLRCGDCGRETSKTELRTESALDALANEWNSSQPAK